MGYVRAEEKICVRISHILGPHICITAVGMFNADCDPVTGQAFSSIYVELELTPSTLMWMFSFVNTLIKTKKL